MVESFFVRNNSKNDKIESRFEKYSKINIIIFERTFVGRGE